MRRWIFGAAIAALLMAVTGCGGGSSTPTVEQEAIPSRVQTRLGIEAQQQLRERFHDRAVEVTDVECERQYTGVSICRLRVVDGHRRRGTILLGVQVNPKTHAVRIGFAGASNRTWLKLLSGNARGAEGQNSTTSRPRK
jgi:hypothetical protein